MNEFVVVMIGGIIAGVVIFAVIQLGIYFVSGDWIKHIK